MEQAWPGGLAGALSGPNLARELMAGFAAARVIATEDAERWPLFARFYQRVVEHPVVAPLLQAEAKALGLSR